MINILELCARPGLLARQLLEREQATPAKRNFRMTMDPVENVSDFIEQLTTADGDGPEQLLQHLCHIQQRYSFIPGEAVELLSTRLRVRFCSPLPLTVTCSPGRTVRHSSRSEAM